MKSKSGPYNTPCRFSNPVSFSGLLDWAYFGFLTSFHLGFVSLSVSFPRRFRSAGFDGKTVMLPPAGEINPYGVAWARIRDEDGNGIYAPPLTEVRCRVVV